MILIPKKLELPNIGETENQDNPKVHLKFFHPFSSWSWFLIEYSEEDELCFGLIDGHEVELGYFSMSELKDLRIKGLPVERDLHWEPIGLLELKEKLKQRRC